MTSRDNLVICCAGDDSMHVQYLDENRNYDVCVIYYGDQENRYREDCELYHAAKGAKYHLLYRVLSENLHLLNRYSHFWIPDDDLETDTATVNRMFDLFAREDLYIAQPSLTIDSETSFTALVTHGMGTCETNFVEVMCPLFTMPSLLHALPFFTETRTGWGIDLIWSGIARLHNHKIGILDQVTVGHYRPLGSSDWYRSLGVDPQQELDDLKKRYNLNTIDVTRFRGKKAAPAPAQDSSGLTARYSGNLLQRPRDNGTRYPQTISPVIVGGQGGSCTRAIAEILIRTNRIYMDVDNRDSSTLDSHCMRTRDWSAGLVEPALIKSIIGSTLSLDYSLDGLPAELQQELRKRSEMLDVLLNENYMKQHDFVRTLRSLGEEYCKPVAWGWKEPRSMYYLPLWQAMFGTFRFIHVVRDVRTIREMHIEGEAGLYKAYFGRQQADPRTGFEELWAALNLDVHRWACRHMPENYLLLRVEKLAEQGETAQREINRLVNFIGVDFTDKKKLGKVFRPLRKLALAPATGKVAEALQTFGYQPGATHSNQVIDSPLQNRDYNSANSESTIPTACDP